jgi:hypothetical protein
MLIKKVKEKEWEYLSVKIASKKWESGVKIN